MLRKLTKLVTNNFGLKVLGAVFAIILWLVIVNVEDPDKPVVFTATVRIENANYLTDMGKTYEVLNDSDVISFTVTGKRSVVEKLSVTDFAVSANMENIDESMTKIPITITAPGYSNQLEITKQSSYVQVNVENVVSGTYSIDVVTEGDLSSYCYIESTSASPKTVSVSGPESIINQIVKAQTVINVSGASDDVSTASSVLLLDASGNEVSQERLTLSLTEVNAEARIRMRKEVSVSFNVSGDLMAGYRLGDISSTVSSVTLEGEAAVLDSMNELALSPSELDISEKTMTYTANIPLADYLPRGVTLAEGEVEEAEVTVEIESQTTAAFEMPYNNITVSGLASGYNLRFDSDTVTVNITGFEDELSSISGQRLYGTLDASDLQAGTQTVPIKITGDYADNSTATASVTITDNNSLEE